LLSTKVERYSDYTDDEVVPYGVITSTAYKVGDILSTARTDLDDTWLLCNGVGIDPALYPDLHNIMQKNYGESGRSYTTRNKLHDSYNIYCCCINGYLIQLTAIQNSIIINYTTERNTLNWETVTIKTNTYGGERCYLSYGDGYWVIATYNSSKGGLLYYSRSLQGQWFENSSMSKERNRYRRVIYANGYWVLAGYDQIGNYARQAKIWYTTDPSSTSWATTNFWYYGNDQQSKYDAIYDIVYAGDKWIVSGHFSSYVPSIFPEKTDSFYRFYAYAYTDDITKSLSGWTPVYEENRGYDGGSSSTEPEPEFLHYIDGVLIRSSITGNYYTSNILSDWSNMNIPAPKVVEFLVKFQDYWVASQGDGFTNSDSLCISDSLEGVWQSIEIYGGSEHLLSLCSNDESVLATGSNHYWYAFNPFGDQKLPLISLDQVYTYIKAKEQQKKEE